MNACTRLGASALAVFAATVTLATSLAPTVQAADPPGCRVRNVTQQVRGTDLGAMVQAAARGDRLRIAGTCAADLVITRDIELVGVGLPRPVLSGEGTHRVVRVARGASVVLRHLSIEGGVAAVGGGICNQGTLTIVDSWVRGNRAELVGGGGIGNLGRLTLTDSVVRDNTFSGDFDTRGLTEPAGCGRSRARAGGGGIANWGTMTVTHAILGRNWAGRGLGGGGLYNDGIATLAHVRIRKNTSSETGGGGLSNIVGATLTLTASSVRENGSSRTAGGIANGGTLRLFRTVVRTNWGYREGGGIVNGGDLELVRSIVRGNTAHEGLGGGIVNFGDASIRRSMIRGNQVTGGGLGAGGGVANTGGIVRIVGSTVRANRSKAGAGIWNSGAVTLAAGTAVTANVARRAGGIWNGAFDGETGTIALRSGSQVFGNTPDDCRGTAACDR